MSRPDPTACAACPVHDSGQLVKLGVDMQHWDYVVALAGNPNTGKSTVFNALTGLRQHTGNWPGKTVTRAEGGFAFGGDRFKLVDLPGTYSLLSSSQDEEVARDFLLFGRPDVTVIVVDANRLERNLNLALQVMEITERVVICLNLIDEARRHGIEVDARRLARDLGVPVVATSARFGEGLDELHRAIAEVASGRTASRPRGAGAGAGAGGLLAARAPGSFPEAPSATPASRETADQVLDRAVRQLAGVVRRRYPRLPNARWVALRLLDGDERVREAVRSGELAALQGLGDSGAEATRESGAGGSDEVLSVASELRWQVGGEFHQALAESLYAEAARIADRAVSRAGEPRRFDLDRTIDRLVTSRAFGFPLMLGMLAAVFWITIVGANVPSALLASFLIDTLHPVLQDAAAAIGMPWWLSGLLVDGMYLATAWVVSVMLPPMAIFFPLFTLLEDFGYLPRVAFNLDRMFQRVGAHGKQALTMAMGFGCNAAAIVSTRIIESPRERLIAMLTNNFALCNGRWPTQILVATIFIGALAPPYLAGVVSAAAVVGVALLGVLLTFVASWALSRTLLRGEVSTFHLELPPYRPPRLLQTLYTSLIDRTVFVLWRAVVFALPAGALIWLLANVPAGDASLAERLLGGLDPIAGWLGLTGVILLAYVIAVPANEIVVPTILMLTVLAAGTGTIGDAGIGAGAGAGAGVLFEPEAASVTERLLRAGGFTLLTAVNLMLFSLVHNPCSTTIYTIWKESRSARWTAVAALMPLVAGLVLCFCVASVWRLVAG